MPGATGSNTTKGAKPGNVAKSPAELAQLAKQAVAQAAAEGLILHRSKTNKTGFKGVTKKDNVGKTSYQVQIQKSRGSKTSFFFSSSFATAEEAALCYARCIL